MPLKNSLKKQTRAVLALIALSLLILFPIESFAYETLVKGLGLFSLAARSDENIIRAELCLEKENGEKTLFEAYDGYIPKGLVRHDLDLDGHDELIVLISFSSYDELLPLFYTLKSGTPEKIPFILNEADPENNWCKELYIANYQGKPAIHAQQKLIYHDYGPPLLIASKILAYENGKIVLKDSRLSSGNHFNIIMNKAAYAMLSGDPALSAQLYEQAIAASSGEITPEIFAEMLIQQAEASAFSFNFQRAMELYEKIVLELPEEDCVEKAQSELEFLNANMDNLNALKTYYEIARSNKTGKTDSAKLALDEALTSLKGNKLYDRLLMQKCDFLISSGKIEEALQLCQQLIAEYPETALFDNVQNLIEELQIIKTSSDSL